MSEDNNGVTHYPETERRELQRFQGPQGTIFWYRQDFSFDIQIYSSSKYSWSMPASVSAEDLVAFVSHCIKQDIMRHHPQIYALLQKVV